MEINLEVGRTYIIQVEDCCFAAELKGVFLGYGKVYEDEMIFDFGTVYRMYPGIIMSLDVDAGEEKGIQNVEVEK